jgi:hypothetical protein
MGNRRTQSMTPDLFAAADAREPTSPSSSTSTSAAAPASPPRIVLPQDLPSALKQLDNQELDRLSVAVTAEQQARGGKRVAVADKPASKGRVEAIPIALSTGKINAVRAAFKAGVKPTQIARQFGISQSDMRKVLASDAKKR